MLPTKLPLAGFYEELVRTQQSSEAHGLARPAGLRWIAAGHLRHGQTNFIRSLWKFGSQYDVQKLLNDHSEPTRYPIALPARKAATVDPKDLYILRPELVGGVAATDADRLGLVNKGEGGGEREAAFRRFPWREESTGVHLGVDPLDADARASGQKLHEFHRHPTP